MEWKISNKKLEKKTEDYSCIVDEITNSKEIDLLSKKYSIPKRVIHEFITELLIKVIKEKKSSEEEIVSKYSMPKEIVDEVKKQYATFQL